MLSAEIVFMISIALLAVMWCLVWALVVVVRAEEKLRQNEREVNLIYGLYFFEEKAKDKAKNKQVQ